MHITKVIISLLLIFVTSTCIARSDQLIVDQYFSPYAGSALNLSIFHTYTFLDDRYFPSSAGKINVFWSIGRIGNLVVEDWLSQFLMVFQHEVFGHGYRLREFGIRDISYFVGIGHGWTSFDPEEYYALPVTKQAAVSAAGMEANAVFSGQIRQNWILQNKIDRREALLYFVTTLDQADYIWITTDDTDNPSNDVYSYVTQVNEWYGNNALSTHKLHRYALWDLLDPSLYMGLYSIGDYILQGSPHLPMYMLDVMCYRYMFAGRLLLAPFGPQFQLQNYLLTPKHRLWQINLTYGNHSEIQSYGLDIFLRPIWHYKEWSFGNKLYLWKQPKFLKQNTAQGIPNGIGIAEFVGAEYKLNKYFAAIGEFGYKTAGYQQGLPLGNSWVWRFGLSLNY